MRSSITRFLISPSLKELLYSKLKLEIGDIIDTAVGEQEEGEVVTVKMYLSDPWFSLQNVATHRLG
jgi:hypothetical protein